MYLPTTAIHAFLGINDPLDELAPIAHVRFSGLKIQCSADILVETFGLQVEWNFVDRVLNVASLDNGFDGDVAIKRDLLAHFGV